jgi:hypothetical protein
MERWTTDPCMRGWANSTNIFCGFPTATVPQCDFADYNSVPGGLNATVNLLKNDSFAIAIYRVVTWRHPFLRIVPNWSMTAANSH